jgi:hypothetical protein
MYNNIIVKGSPISEGLQRYTNDSRLSLKARGCLASIIDDVVVEGLKPNRKRRWSIAHLCRDLLYVSPGTAYACISELKRFGYYENDHDTRIIRTYPKGNFVEGIGGKGVKK